MIATLVHIQVNPQYIGPFLEATRANHEQSVMEPGNLRFDVLQDASDPARFVLYEAYASEHYASLHKETGHYRAWRDKVAPWMAKPREGVKHHLVYPSAGE